MQNHSCNVNYNTIKGIFESVILVYGPISYEFLQLRAAAVLDAIK
jgi:hypothetical protein